MAMAMTSAAKAQSPPPVPMTPPTLMIDRGEVQAKATLRVSSADFAAGDPIPLTDSGYAGSRSPPLSIAGAPRAAKSFVILMDDPASRSCTGSPIIFPATSPRSLGACPPAPC
jgi:hypothetical protein